MTLARLGILEISRSWWHNFVLVPQSVIWNREGDPLTLWRPGVVWTRDLTGDLPCYARLMEQGGAGVGVDVDEPRRVRSRSSIN